MALDPQDFMDRMKTRMNFGADDQQCLKAHADWGRQVAPAMADCFYSYLGRDDEMNQILHATDGRIHRLHQTFVDWFHEMFTGIDDWGSQYAQRRWHIGLVHVRLGIGPQHVVPAMAIVVQAIGQHLQAMEQAQSLQSSLSKICMIDLTFIEQAYVEVSAEAVLRETGWSERLFRRLVVTGVRI
ncbi:MAG: protoglobin domain-containing protein [Elainellaceae cyanobacterium]